MKNAVKLLGITSFALVAPFVTGAGANAQTAVLNNSAGRINAPQIVIPNNRIIPRCNPNAEVCHWRRPLEIPELPECDPTHCDPSPIDPAQIRELDLNIQRDQLQKIENIQRLRSVQPASQFLKFDDYDD